LPAVVDFRPATIADYKWLYEHTEYMLNSQPWRDPPLMWLLDRLPATVVDVGGGRFGFVGWLIERCRGHDGDFCSTDPAIDGPALPYITAEWERDYATCFDVLEHIPEHTIPAALENLAGLGTKGCVCSIAQMSERRMVKGEWVDLHVTRQGPDWWLERFRAAFGRADIKLHPLHYPERFWITVEKRP
jgi:hypothetical protein